MEEKISPLLKCHIHIFRLFGLCTLTFGRNPIEESFRRQRWLRLWSLFLLVTFNIVTMAVLFINDSILFSGDKFGFFNDVLIFVFSDVALTSSFLEAVFKRQSHYEFWRLYSELQDPPQENNSTQLLWLKEIRKNLRFVVMFYTFLISEIFVIGAFLLLENLLPNTIYFWLTCWPYLMVVHLRNMQFIFYIELIRQQLQRLRNDLHLMVEYSRFHAYGTGFRGFEEFLRCRIVEKQRVYQRIYEMYDHFQNSFGVSIVAVLLVIYIRIVVDCYFCYFNVYRDRLQMGRFDAIHIVGFLES